MKIPALSILTLALAVNMAVQAQSTPVGTASAGAGITVTATPSQTTIIQSNSRGIINWDSGFRVPLGHNLIFQQPNANAIVLNRDKSGSASHILGSITGNGQVWIINESGILFGANSQINVAGLLASTADISNNRFLVDDFRFSGATQGIINQGEIRAQYYAVLAGRSVNNSGLIQSDLGQIALGAGSAWSLDIANNNLLRFEITDPNLLAEIRNTGTVSAAGGRIYISASQAQNAVGGVVNVGGLVNADTVQNVAGAIQIVARDVTITGTVSAATVAQSGDTAPGQIAIMGDSITLASTATVVSQADLSGGTVYLGTDPTIPVWTGTTAQQPGSQVITAARGLPPPPPPPPVLVPASVIVPVEQLYSVLSPAVREFNLPQISTTSSPAPGPISAASTTADTEEPPQAQAVTQSSATDASIQVSTDQGVTQIAVATVTASNTTVGAATLTPPPTPRTAQDADDPVLAAAATLRPAGRGFRPRTAQIPVIPGLITVDATPLRLRATAEDRSLPASGNRSRW